MNTLLPLLFSTWWAELDRPHRLLDQNFGLGLAPEQLMLPDDYYLIRKGMPIGMYLRPWADLWRKDGGGISTVTADKDKFKVILDVQQFKPEEINVKVVDKFIVVEAKHEEKKDEHGLISRQFVRKYLIPERADIDKVSSQISSDGVLTIIAPLKELPESEKNERVIKIEHTGKPALTGKEKGKEKDETTTENTTEQTDQATENPPK